MANGKTQTNQSVNYTRSTTERPLTTDERASFVILSLYLFVFCLATFVYWDILLLQILGVTAATMGLFLFFASFFNRESPEERTSIHPVRSYLISFFLVLTVLLFLRLVGGLIETPLVSTIVLYSGLGLSLVIFRKALVQVITAMLALVFLFVTIYNWDSVLNRQLSFKDSITQCGHALFKIGPIQDMANMLIAGSYYTYLGKVDYRDEQINIMATRIVAKANDDELLKTRALLQFVSNKIHYVSDPGDGLEYAKKPITTLIAGGGDCEDQTLLLCSMMESVGVKTYIAFTEQHVFALVEFANKYPELKVEPTVYKDDIPLYALDPSDRDAQIGFTSASSSQIHRIFDVSRRLPIEFCYTADP